MIGIVAIALLLSGTLVCADQKGDPIAQAGIKEFMKAFEKWDASGFAAAAGLFQRACAADPANSTNYYWLGVAQFHRMLQLRSQPLSRTNALAADNAMEAALAALETAVKLDGSDAETHALLGTLYGMKIGGNLLRGARFGPRVARHQKQALAFGAQNPRVRYLLGTCQFHTAKRLSSQREALDTLLTAEKLFADEAQRPPVPLEPRWGRSSCLNFIGRTYELLDQRAEAAAYFRKALAAHPADFVAKEGLARVTDMEKK